MRNLKLLSVSLFLLIGTHFGFSQLGFSHEIGAIVGPVQFRSYYGVRKHEGTNFGNSGFGIGIVHYINFSYSADCNCYSTANYFNDHFKLRSEVSFNSTKLDHHGEWADGNSVEAEKLRAHTGEANNLDIGMQLEYYPFSIRDFQAFAYRFAPFVSLGIHYTSYRPKVYTAFGDQNINNASNFWGAWDADSIDSTPGSTWSAVTSLGVRYKLTALSDLMLDLRLQYYGNDWIDGLNHQLASNKHNDWLVWLNVGYIYYLD
ncbi:MAG: glutamate dehydrogenase [Xanthomarina sp.]